MITAVSMSAPSAIAPPPLTSSPAIGSTTQQNTTHCATARSGTVSHDVTRRLALAPRRARAANAMTPTDAATTAPSMPKSTTNGRLTSRSYCANAPSSTCAKVPGEKCSSAPRSPFRSSAYASSDSLMSASTVQSPAGAPVVKSSATRDSTRSASISTTSAPSARSRSDPMRSS